MSPEHQLYSLILLAGWRYRGPRGIAVRLGVGGLGACDRFRLNGRPPVFLYLMSGPGSAASGANFLAFGLMVQIGAVLSYAFAGLITLDILLMAGILFVPFTLACWIGMRLFVKVSDTQFRNYTLWGIAVLSLVIAVV